MCLPFACVSLFMARVHSTDLKKQAPGLWEGAKRKKRSTEQVRIGELQLLVGYKMVVVKTCQLLIGIICFRDRQGTFLLSLRLLMLCLYGHVLKDSAHLLIL